MRGLWPIFKREVFAHFVTPDPLGKNELADTDHEQADDRHGARQRRGKLALRERTRHRADRQVASADREDRQVPRRDHVPIDLAVAAEQQHVEQGRQPHRCVNQHHS